MLVFSILRLLPGISSLMKWSRLKLQVQYYQFVKEPPIHRFDQTDTTGASTGVSTAGGWTGSPSESLTLGNGNSSTQLPNPEPQFLRLLLLLPYSSIRYQLSSFFLLSFILCSAPSYSASSSQCSYPLLLAWKTSKSANWFLCRCYHETLLFRHSQSCLGTVVTPGLLVFPCVLSSPYFHVIFHLQIPLPATCHLLSVNQLHFW